MTQEQYRIESLLEQEFDGYTCRSHGELWAGAAAVGKDTGRMFIAGGADGGFGFVNLSEIARKLAP